METPGTSWDHYRQSRLARRGLRGVSRFVQQAQSIMIRLARSHPNVLKDPPSEVFLMDLADSSVNLKLVARTKNFRNKFLTETPIREQVYVAFNEEGIEIPFPQHVVHLQSASHGKRQNTAKRKKTRR